MTLVVFRRFLQRFDELHFMENALLAFLHVFAGVS